MAGILIRYFHCSMSHRRAVALMILATLLWSIAGVVTRHLDAAPGFEINFWRSLFNAFALYAALSWRQGPGFALKLLAAPRLVWLSGLCWAMMFTAFMIALTLTTVANVLVTLAIGPLVAALFSRVFLRHRLPARTWFAILLAGAGIAWMFGREASEGTSLFGSLVALTVPIAAAANWTLLQAAGKAETAPDMLPAILIGAVLSALATLPLAWPLQASAHDLGLLALLGVVQLALPCLLVVRVSRALPAAEIALLGLLETLFGVTWAWLGAGERPDTPTLIGGTLVIGALLANELLVRQNRPQTIPVN